MFFSIFPMFSLLFNTQILESDLENNRYVPADYIIMADEITDEVVAKLTKRYNMDVIGMGGGMAGCVNVIIVSFQIRGPIPKEELRKIIVDCVEEFLAAINKNEAIRPFLKTYPFTSQGIKIKLFVTDKNRIGERYPEISHVGAAEGKIIYASIDKDNHFRYKTIEEEDYETALEIVKGKKS